MGSGFSVVVSGFNVNSSVISVQTLGFSVHLSSFSVQPPGFNVHLLWFSVYSHSPHKKSIKLPGNSMLKLRRGERLKEFIGTFLACVIVCSIFSFFFLGLIVEYIWFAIILVAFVFAVLITAFIKQEARIEELEQRVEQFLSSSAQN